MMHGTPMAARMFFNRWQVDQQLASRVRHTQHGGHLLGAESVVLTRRSMFGDFKLWPGPLYSSSSAAP